MKDFHQYTDHIVFIDSSPDEMKYYSILPNYHMSVRIKTFRIKKELVSILGKGDSAVGYSALAKIIAVIFVITSIITVVFVKDRSCQEAKSGKEAEKTYNQRRASCYWRK